MMLPTSALSSQYKPAFEFLTDTFAPPVPMFDSSHLHQSPFRLNGAVKRTEWGTVVTYCGRDFRRSTACRQRGWTGILYLALSAPPRCSPELFYPWKCRKAHKNERKHMWTVFNHQDASFLVLTGHTLHHMPWAWSPACVWSWRSCSASWFPGWLEAGGAWRWRRVPAEAAWCPRYRTAAGSGREGTSAGPGCSAPERVSQC